MIMDTYNFDEIRPFDSSELQEAFALLMKNETVRSFIRQIFPQIPLELVEAQLKQIKTSYEFQKLFICKNTSYKNIS